MLIYCQTFLADIKCFLLLKASVGQIEKIAGIGYILKIIQLKKVAISRIKPSKSATLTACLSGPPPKALPEHFIL